MRARPPSGEQLVTEYLARVEQAARLLPKGARMSFLGRTRMLVEREVGPPGTRTDPQLVIQALARLGEPEDLVREEGARIDPSWVKGRTPTAGPWNGGSPGAGAPASGTPRAGSAGAGTPAGAGSRSTRPRSPGPRSGAPRRLRSADSLGTDPLGTGPQGTGPEGAGARGPAPQATPQGAGAPGAGTEEDGHTSPIEWLIGQFQSQPQPQRQPQGKGQGKGKGKVQGKGGVNEAKPIAAAAGRLARDNVLEAVAILLLGLGGLILPFPFWPIGAIVAMFSRLWDVRDKLLAVVGPLLVTLVVSVLVALYVGGHGDVIVLYFHAVRRSIGVLVRVGSVITAAYLAWRVSQGPRIKVLPWHSDSR